ncbi:MAG: PfkB family carbohydrate kinase [Terrimesophilobacter sp.]
MSARLICLGNVIVDVTASVPALPVRGGDVIAHSGAMLTGGSGFNVMVAASRLGIHSVYAGTHGSGPAGELARSALANEGIECLYDPEMNLDTGWDIAITDAGAERTFVTVVGAEASLTAEHLARVTSQPGDAVYVSGYGLLAEPNCSAILGWLENLPPEVMVVTDPGPLAVDLASDTLERAWAATTWWSGNLQEAQHLTNRSDPADAAGVLGARNMGVVVRLGHEGCLVLAPGDEPVSVPGFDVEAIDSNGAGDAHVGAFLASLLLGYSPANAAWRANGAAAISVTRSGPASSPDSAELDRFLSHRAVK